MHDPMSSTWEQEAVSSLHHCHRHHLTFLQLESHSHCHQICIVVDHQPNCACLKKCLYAKRALYQEDLPPAAWALIGPPKVLAIAKFKIADNIRMDRKNLCAGNLAMINQSPNGALLSRPSDKLKKKNVGMKCESHRSGVFWLLDSTKQQVNGPLFQAVNAFS